MDPMLAVYGLGAVLAVLVLLGQLRKDGWSEERIGELRRRVREDDPVSYDER